MAKQNVPVGRQVVDVVAKGVGGSCPVSVEVKKSRRQMATVEPVAYRQGG